MNYIDLTQAFGLLCLIICLVCIIANKKDGN
jgi:hypothetical protein